MKDAIKPDDMHKSKDGNNEPPADGGVDIEALKAENERIMGGYQWR